MILAAIERMDDGLTVLSPGYSQNRNIQQKKKKKRNIQQRGNHYCLKVSGNGCIPTFE